MNMKNYTTLLAHMTNTIIEQAQALDHANKLLRDRELERIKLGVTDEPAPGDNPYISGQTPAQDALTELRESAYTKGRESRDIEVANMADQIRSLRETKTELRRMIDEFERQEKYANASIAEQRNKLAATKIELQNANRALQAAAIERDTAKAELENYKKGVQGELQGARDNLKYETERKVEFRSKLNEVTATLNAVIEQREALKAELDLIKMGAITSAPDAVRLVRALVNEVEMYFNHRTPGELPTHIGDAMKAVKDALPKAE